MSAQDFNSRKNWFIVLNFAFLGVNFPRRFRVRNYPSPPRYVLPCRDASMKRLTYYPFQQM